MCEVVREYLLLFGPAAFGKVLGGSSQQRRNTLNDTRSSGEILYGVGHEVQR